MLAVEGAACVCVVRIIEVPEPFGDGLTIRIDCCIFEENSTRNVASDWAIGLLVYKDQAS